MLATKKNGDMLSRSNSSNIIHRALTPSRNPLNNSISTAYPTHDLYTSKPGLVLRKSNASNASRGSSLNKINNSFVSNMNTTPKDSRVFVNLNATNTMRQQTVKKLDFTPAYIDLESEPQTPIKKFQ